MPLIQISTRHRLPSRLAALHLAIARTLFVACTGVAVSAMAQPLTPGVVPHPAPKLAAGTDASLSADLFYRLLLGDVALQRGDPALAARAYYEAARDSGDARIARRATEIALTTRQRMLTQESAKLWATLDPAAERPKQILAGLAAGSSGKEVPEPAATSEIRVRLEKLLAEAAVNGQGVGDIFLQLNGFFAQQGETQQSYEMIRDLARPYGTAPESHFAVALAAFTSTDVAIQGKALPAIETALTLRPDWERGALLKAEILARQSRPSALAYLQAFVQANPDARGAAGALAQLLVEQKRFVEARAIFQALWDRDRSARELEFGVAMISVQMKDYETAEALFLDLKKAGYGEGGVVELYLAQIAEETSRYQEAIDRYNAMPEGERAWYAKLRVAAIMGKQGRVTAARQYLNDLPAVTIDQRVQVRQAEAQLLRDANDHAEAYVVLAKALKEHPDSTDLLYDSAMVAEKLDRIDEAEQQLRRVLELKPDDAQALNALGYTLVDRTKRLTEGLGYIERANKISPEDPFIMDSMGWALFRLGRSQDAETYLTRALALRPDAEIAAHLGEVLWARGDHAKAQEVWQSQLKASPDHPVLLETVRRLAR
jgi:tetratricopeptide (TPR) repeat protein